MKPWQTCKRMMRKKKSMEKKMKDSWSSAYNRWSQCYCMDTYVSQWNWETFFLLMWLLGSSRMNSEVYWALLSAQIQSNTTKLIGWHFTVQIYNNSNLKQTKSFFGKRNRMVLNVRVSHLTSTQLISPFTSWRQNWRQNDPQTSRNWSWLQ